MMRVKAAAAASIAVLVAIGAPARPALAATAGELNRDARSALNKLYQKQASSKVLAQKAKAILVFPSMVKAGFMFGGQIGEGVLLKGGKPVAYYSSVAASYGFQAGIQSFGYALFFMNEAAIQQLNATNGFEIGVGPSIVLVDEGIGRSITSNTLTSDVYAFIFDQRGLMAGLGIQGSKISRIQK
ncbi:MAG TPA: lipid-binding SYLF domain-containing protein [Candidatus Binatia bacterium]